MGNTTEDDFGRTRNDTGRAPGWFPTSGEGLNMLPPIQIQRSGVLRRVIPGRGVPPGGPGALVLLIPLAVRQCKFLRPAATTHTAAAALCLSDDVFVNCWVSTVEGMN